jgi:hypothetical protein
MDDKRAYKARGCRFSAISFHQLDSQKFYRHAGLDPASSCRILLKRFWIPAFAGMTAFFGDY